jgi:hypothetical protein
MDDLIAFAAARLDELEAAAKSAAAETAAGWFTGASEDSDERSVCYTGPSTLHPGSTWDYHIADRVPQAAAAHIALHDPGRVLREVAADRKILTLLRQDVVNGRERDYEATEMLEWVVKIRAGRFDSHPDYRPEWKP